LQLQESYSLYFHQDLSPNDENISYGQMVYYIYNIDQVRDHPAGVQERLNPLSSVKNQEVTV
ncbi:MAG: hypothetical protein KGM98_09180, partial [Bacteroidota bacterium]|nr:hypothetical protein [Bacteroidota bacterium]